MRDLLLKSTESRPDFVALPGREHPTKKPGRNTYVRYFPERLTFMLDMLTGEEFIATMRLSMYYVICGGELAADDGELAEATRLSSSKWLKLKRKLINLGLGKVENSYWVDDDQLHNIRIQQSSSERGKRGAMARWGASNAA